MSAKQSTAIVAGEKYGRWEALALAVVGKHPKWSCRCECGIERSVCSSDLRSGKSKSCGCLNREIVSALKKVTEATHGATRGGKRTRAYGVWQSMRRRCEVKSHKAYQWYGGRGITVCRRWAGPDGFVNFLEDMGEPAVGMTIDRIDNSQGYKPENCRWATQKEQQRNRRSNLLITFDGRTQTLVEWAEETGLGRQTIKSRITKHGWSVERALTTPLKPRKGVSDAAERSDSE